MENKSPPLPVAGERYQPMSFVGNKMKTQKGKKGKCERKKSNEERTWEN
jgi:hypothetical protein